MKDFFVQNKIFIAVIVGTLALLFGGVFLFSKNGSSTSSAPKVSDIILNPEGAEKTSGIKDGKYLPASTDAKVTLVEFGDYECPACGAYSPIVKQILTDFQGKINFVFRNFPLSQHANALISSYAAEASGLQGKFWEMHDKLYDSQNDWAASTDAKSIFVGYAKDLNLNADQFNKDIDSASIKATIQKGLDDGNLAKIDATPTFFINGVKIDNPQSVADFEKLITDAFNNSKVTQTPSDEAYQILFDLKVLIDGKPLNLALPKYQSVEGKELDPYIHLHDGNGKVVHVHKQDIPLKELFDSLKIAIPAGEVAYVNGKKVDDILNYIPQDLDQILIGSSNLSLVSKDACIYSLKCQERGTPPPESCVGGLGTGCSK